MINNSWTVSLTPNNPEPLSDLLSRLASAPVAWIRLAAARYDDAWEVEVLDIVTGAAPESWQAERLAYPDAVFVAARTKGSTVVGWLQRGRGRLNGKTLTFPELNQMPQVRREAGRSRSVYFESSRWPTIVTDLIGSSRMDRQQPQQMLVRAGMPTFHNFATAARYLVRDTPAVDSTISRRLSYRHLDTKARIALVEYTDEDLWVSVEGDGLAGVTVELMGSVPGPAKTIRQAPKRPVHLKLAQGIPRNAFVVLVAGDRALDEKVLGWDYPAMQDPDVRRLIKVDPSARLQALLFNKEGEQVEFKLGVNAETDDDEETVMKTVAAFANGAGGSLFFGINKRYEVIGIREQNVQELEDNLSNLIDDWVHPAPLWSFDLLTVPRARTRFVVELIVNAGEWPPYAVGTMRRNMRYYVRHAGRSLPARPDEVRALGRSRPPEAPPVGFPSFRHS